MFDFHSIIIKGVIFPKVVEDFPKASVNFLILNSFSFDVPLSLFFLIFFSLFLVVTCSNAARCAFIGPFASSLTGVQHLLTGASRDLHSLQGFVVWLCGRFAFYCRCLTG